MALAASSLTAQGATLPTQWGVSAATVWADCTDLACDQLSFVLGNPINGSPVDGGLNATVASQIDVAQIHDTVALWLLATALGWLALVRRPLR